jgi:putative peptide maturation system protein
MSEDTALEVNGEVIALREVLKFAKWRTQTAFIWEAADAALVRQASAERGITVSDEEIQQAADAFRLEHELYDAQKTEEWLSINHLACAEWEELLEYEITCRKLREELIHGSIERYFAERRTSFDAVNISRLVVKEEDLARELRAQIVEDGADFHVLSREHSIDLQTRPAGGYAGRRVRSEMDASVEAAVFGAQPGRTVGPMKTDDGWELIKVEEFHFARLDESMRETIKSLLFSQWLTEQRLKAKIKIPLLDPTCTETAPASVCSK